MSINIRLHGQRVTYDYITISSQSVPDLAEVTVCKTGIIFDCRRSTQPASVNSWAVFLPTVFKINLSFGFILRNTETEALQYHHPSANNNLVLEQPFLVSNREDLERLYEEISNIDFLEWVRQSGRTVNGG